MRYTLLRAAVPVLLVTMAIQCLGAARAEAPPGEEPFTPPSGRFMRMFIEIEERHRDLAGKEGAAASEAGRALPYSFDSRRHVLRPTPELQWEDFLPRSSVIVLHRIRYAGERRTASYRIVHRFNDFPVEIDLRSAPQQDGLALTADEQQRLVGPITISALKTPAVHVQYGKHSADLAEGQGWTSPPAWSPAVFSGLRRPVQVSSEVSVRFWGICWYSTYATEEQEAESVLSLLGRGGDPERLRAQELIGIGDAAIPGLTRKLKGEPDEIEKSLGCLEWLYAREAVPEIVPLLDSPRWDVAKEAIRVLGRLEDPRAVEPLLKVAKESEDPRLAAAAAFALGAIGDDRAVPALTGLLSDPDPKKKMAAAAGLGLMGRKDGLPFALALLGGEDMKAAKEAFGALWLIGGPEAQEALFGFARRHEGDRIAEDALAYARVLAIRLAPQQERQRLLEELKGDKTSAGFLAQGRAMYEIEWLPTEEAVTLLRGEMEWVEEQDPENVPYVRMRLWRVLAREAWRRAVREGNTQNP